MNHPEIINLPRLIFTISLVVKKKRKEKKRKKKEKKEAKKLIFVFYIERPILSRELGYYRNHFENINLPFEISFTNRSVYKCNTNVAITSVFYGDWSD